MGIIGILGYFGVAIYYVGPYLLLIGGITMFICGMVERAKTKYAPKPRGLALIIAGVIAFLPGGIISGGRGIKAVNKAIDNYNNIGYQLSNGSVDDVERLLKKGACVEDAGLPEERPAREGELTLLGCVANYGLIYPDAAEKAELLIEYGADVNRVMCCTCDHPYYRSDFCSATPIIIAADTPNYELLKVLIDNGADVNAADYYGSTALDIVEKNLKGSTAFKNVYAQMKELLIQNGAQNGNTGSNADKKY